jgi:DNA-binding transcriptional MerR regulator
LTGPSPAGNPNDRTSLTSTDTLVGTGDAQDPGNAALERRHDVQPTPKEAYYTTDEISRLTGLSYRQLDYWDRTGLYTPTRPTTGHGVPRGYTATDLAHLQVLARLRHLGCTRRILTHVAATLDPDPATWPPCLILDPDGHQLDHITDPRGCWVLPLRATHCCAA